MNEKSIIREPSIVPAGMYTLDPPWTFFKGEINFLNLRSDR